MFAHSLAAPSTGRRGLVFVLALAAGCWLGAPLWAAPAAPTAVATVHGTLTVWGDVIIDFAGPVTDEQATPNPFLDDRLNVTFRNTASGEAFVVPGYYAADGNAAETSASAGGTWRVHFVPDSAGTWTWSVSFRTGADVAVSLDPVAGAPTAFNGASGTLTITPMNVLAPGFHAQGLLVWDGRRYLHAAGSGALFSRAARTVPKTCWLTAVSMPRPRRTTTHRTSRIGSRAIPRGNPGKGKGPHRRARLPRRQRREQHLLPHLQCRRRRQ